MTPEDNALLVQIGRGQEMEADARRAVPKFILARLGLRIAIAAAGIGCVVFAYRLPAESYSQSLISNLATGLLVFLAVVPTLRASKAFPRRTVAVGVLIAAGLLTTGYLMAGVTQSLLINGAVGVLLLIALDVTINRWLDVYATAEEKARGLRQIAAEMIRSGKSELDFKYTLLDYLGLPRPDEFGGIPVDDGESVADEVMKAAGLPPLSRAKHEAE